MSGPNADSLFEVCLRAFIKLSVPNGLDATIFETWLASRGDAAFVEPSAEDTGIDLDDLVSGLMESVDDPDAPADAPAEGSEEVAAPAPEGEAPSESADEVEEVGEVADEHDDSVEEEEEEYEEEVAEEGNES